MTPAGDILFASVDAIPLFDKKQAAAEILSLDKKYSFWDDYRFTRMFPLSTKNAALGRAGTSNMNQGEFSWTDLAPQSIVDWCENYVFPWIGMRTRVMALLTEPGVSNYEHFDIDPFQLNTQQHKFRIVLQGNTNSLYWCTDQGTVAAPDIESAFIIDGGWPHGMTNVGDEIKVTLALGSPWQGNDQYSDDITILQNRNHYRMPADISSYWPKP